eukprot:TRINITY_DN4435_c0_g1_i3.p1 TRINITY_DN4435_c0_g1~~TRINITY_DN4435_c0_g1_i3.p1  ORF type:complete len:394 (+),score=131.63 TRINITY_DN4435_c0_g1_i3:54-1184(+)
MPSTKKSAEAPRMSYFECPERRRRDAERARKAAMSDEEIAKARAEERQRVEEEEKRRRAQRRTPVRASKPAGHRDSPRRRAEERAGAQKRADPTNGQQYTRLQFVDYYGAVKGNRLWDEAEKHPNPVTGEPESREQFQKRFGDDVEWRRAVAHCKSLTDAPLKIRGPDGVERSRAELVADFGRKGLSLWEGYNPHIARRYDERDGNLYTKREFASYYGGYSEWDAAGVALAKSIGVKVAAPASATGAETAAEPKERRPAAAAARDETDGDVECACLRKLRRLRKLRDAAFTAEDFERCAALQDEERDVAAAGAAELRAKMRQIHEEDGDYSLCTGYQQRVQAIVRFVTVRSAPASPAARRERDLSSPGLSAATSDA